MPFASPFQEAGCCNSDGLQKLFIDRAALIESPPRSRKVVASAWHIAIIMSEQRAMRHSHPLEPMFAIQ